MSPPFHGALALPLLQGLAGDAGRVGGVGFTYQCNTQRHSLSFKETRCFYQLAHTLVPQHTRCQHRQRWCVIVLWLHGGGEDFCIYAGAGDKGDAARRDNAGGFQSLQVVGVLNDRMAAFMIQQQTQGQPDKGAQQACQWVAGDEHVAQPGD